MSSDEEQETQQQKRLRLTKSALTKLKQTAAEDYGFDAKDLDEEIIKKRIQEFVAPVTYHYLKQEKVLKTSSIKLHEVPTAICYAKEFLYIATKDCSIIQYNMATSTKKTVRGEMKQTQRWIERVGHQELVGHSDTILTMDISFDGKYLVSAIETESKGERSAAAVLFADGTLQ
jgi:hypothetical protein